MQGSFFFLLGSTLIKNKEKTYSIQILSRCLCWRKSLCKAAAILESPDMMIVAEVGGGTSGRAMTRRSSGAEFAAASRDTRRFSARGRVLSTVLLGRRCASSGAKTCRQFPDLGKL